MSTRLRPTAEPPCPPRKSGPLKTYAEIVEHYIANKRPTVNANRLIFKKRTLKEAINYAALAKLPNGTRHPHQYRLKQNVLDQSEQRLQKLAKRLQVCETFSELHEVIDQEIGEIHGMGVLTVYDTANSIGAHLGLEPKDIYLHAGTKKGAKILGLGKGQTASRDDLPEEFQKLKPQEIEDCLCSYAKDLANIKKVK